MFLQYGYQSDNRDGEKDFHTPFDASLTNRNCSQSPASFDDVVVPVLICKHSLAVPNNMGTESSISVHAHERSFER